METYKIPALGVEIMERDMSVDDLVGFHCKLQPQGWRLPTREEMQVIYDLGKLEVIKLRTKPNNCYTIKDDAGFAGESAFPAHNWKGGQIRTVNRRLVRDL